MKYTEEQAREFLCDFLPDFFDNVTFDEKRESTYTFQFNNHDVTKWFEDKFKDEPKSSDQSNEEAQLKEKIGSGGFEIGQVESMSEKLKKLSDALKYESKELGKELLEYYDKHKKALENLTKNVEPKPKEQEELPETGLVVYKDKPNQIVFVTNKKMGYGYGFNVDGTYCLYKGECQYSWTYDQYTEDWRTATEKDEKLFLALLKNEAVRLGFKDGVEYYSATDHKGVCELIDFESLKFADNSSFKDGKEMVLTDGYGGAILCNGKWAEKLEDQNKEVKIDFQNLPEEQPEEDITDEEAEKAMKTFIQWFGDKAKKMNDLV